MSLTIRPATLDDARLLFDWRNDPATREASHNSSEVVFDSHLAWLKASLVNPQRQLLIAEENGKPVGTVRIDHEADNCAELSWTVAPECRGNGIGKRMVKAAAGSLPNLSLRAEVKASNPASIKVAEAAGMLLDKQVDGVLHYRRSAYP